MFPLKQIQFLWTTETKSVCNWTFSVWSLRSTQNNFRYGQLPDLWNLIEVHYVLMYGFHYPARLKFHVILATTSTWCPSVIRSAFKKPWQCIITLLQKTWSPRTHSSVVCVIVKKLESYTRGFLKDWLCCYFRLWIITTLINVTIRLSWSLAAARQYNVWSM